MKSDTKIAIYACSLLFVATAAIFICYTYVNAIFLSTYPTTLLPYLYISEAISIAVVLFLIAPLLSGDNNRYPFAIYLILTSVVVSFIFMSQISHHWLPFVICVSLLIIEAILGVISWNAVTAAFDIRQFKTVGKWISLSGLLGGVISGFSAIFMIKTFGTFSLLYVIAILLLCASLLVSKLPRIPTIKRINQHKQNAFSYQLYRKIFLYVMTASLLYTIIDYGFKAQLATHYSKTGIGEFTAAFLAICAIGTITVQLFGAQKIIKRFGAVGLLAILPLFWLLTAAGVLAAPGLITIVIMAAGWNIFNYSYSNLGQQLMLNILPPHPQQRGRFYCKALSFPIGLCFSALLLIFTDQLTIELSVIAIVVIIFTSLLLLVAIKLKKSYQTTLERVIIFKYFSENATFYDVKNSPKKQVSATIPSLLKGFIVRDIGLKHHIIKVVIKLNNSDADKRLLAQYHHKDIVTCNFIAKEMALRSLHVPPSKKLTVIAERFALKEANYIKKLTSRHDDKWLLSEVKARIQLAKTRYLHWFAIATKPYNVMQIIPIIVKPKAYETTELRTEIAKAIELLESLAKPLLSSTIGVLETKKTLDKKHLKIQDTWLQQVISYCNNDYKLNYIMPNNMDKVFILRSNPVFNNLLGEFLLILAQKIKINKFNKGTVIFSKGDKPNGLYIISNGKVAIRKKTENLMELTNPDIFGELALLDNSLRAADAIAKTDVTLLLLAKDIFEDITDKLPEILHAIAELLVHYIRSNIKARLQYA